MAKKYIFTITPGRTGTLFLAEFLIKNLPKCEVHHEILGYDSFGVDSPDLSTLTLFNSQGNIEKVKKFWKQKLSRIKETKVDYYAEASHILAKAGLLENLNYLGKDAEIHFVLLDRDAMKIIESLHARFDFLNIGDIWLWFLDPQYPIKILDPSHFKYLSVHGSRLWYVYEMRARGEYYKQKFKDKKNIHFHSLNVGDLNKTKGAKGFLLSLGVKRKTSEIIIPPKLNVTKTKQAVIDDNTREIIKNEMKKPFDPRALAKEFIDLGGGWDR
jgi:hypothetical protein